MEISIICPIYNGQKYIKGLYSEICNQRDVNIREVKFILTESSDRSEEILKELNLNYEKIKPEEFSHSLIREKEAFSAGGDIIVFITQDIKICNENWLHNLVEGIISGECEAAFSRQIAYENHYTEKYIREKNYPETSRVVSKKDIDKLGLMTFFFSDASSAICKKVFTELNGYDSKDLPTSEDMYIAYKIIMNGYRIKYAADSKVVHSHKYDIRGTIQRYKAIGAFFKQNPHLKRYNANKRGVEVLIYTFKRAIKEKKYSVILQSFFDMIIRFVGMNLGKITH
ncbi:glycosyltransferase [Clostridium tertium]|uniref:glycosyltransferase n=1 Tax=Clostridium tertium TaxID=1559 RepID=UPI003DA3F977